MEGSGLVRGIPVAVLAGAMAVAGCHSSSSGPTTTGQLCSSSTVALSSGSSQIVPCSGASVVSVTGGGASYIVVPQFAVGDTVPYVATSYSISVNSGGSSVMRVPPTRTGPAFLQAAGPGQSDAFQGAGAPQRLFDAQLLARARSYANRGRLQRAAMMKARASLAVSCCPPSGSVKRFHVLASESPDKYQAVDARLSYVGSNLLLYIDTLSPQTFTATQLQTFGQFTDQVLYPLDTIFGTPTDIDNNGHVIMLLTPVVNGLTPKSQCSNGFVGGFFFAHDLVDKDTTSNQAEIFYGIAPDSLGTVSCAHPVSTIEPCPQAQTQPAGCGLIADVFLHEMQHLINFANHALITGGSEEEGWLDEGESIVAEEQGSIYFEKKYPPPQERTNSAQLFPDSAQGFLNFLSQFPLYVERPDTQSVTLHSDADNGLSWRGGDWLLLRWLGDQFGNAYYKTLNHDIEVGTANLAFAAGQSFPTLFGNFGISLYADSIPGFPRTTAATNNRFTSRNIRQLLNRLFQNQEIPSAFPLPVGRISATPVTASMVPGTNAYYRLDTSSQGTVQITFSAVGGGNLPTNLHPQLAIFRLPPGA